MTKPATAFVIGHPIGHSKSPVLHNYWLSKHGLAGSYLPVDVAPADLEAFVQRIRSGEFIGGNVTIPHKEAVLPFVDEASEVALLLGAANTLWMENGVLKATNTDGYGFVANLDQHAPGWQTEAVKRNCLVIGAGGAARAVVHALVGEGFSTVHLANRTVSRAETMARDLPGNIRPCGLDVLADLATECDFIVNTSSIGMAGHGEDDKAGSGFFSFLENAPPGTLVTDIVYAPLETPLLQKARQEGLKTVDGLGMLLHQAVPGFEKWFAIRPQVNDELRAHVLASGRDNGSSP